MNFNFINVVFNKIFKMLEFYTFFILLLRIIIKPIFNLDLNTFISHKLILRFSKESVYPHRMNKIFRFYLANKKGK